VCVRFIYFLMPSLLSLRTFLAFELAFGSVTRQGASTTSFLVGVKERYVELASGATG
jgi:hypothetical protein